MTNNKYVLYFSLLVTLIDDKDYRENASEIFQQSIAEVNGWGFNT